ncbi:Uma2 family endonuclease [Pleurocapsa sp. FMAR1]|uniref:Uma2 family endonuclease n=1 Tax=Pleurocapsa sp. FMAR1 TaxID=3040204 RepID=UPI0029C9409B|nr:Uma2 family endonuclease [Pleurocapsa sp. FMAR1]
MLTQKLLSNRFTLEEYLNFSQVDSEKIYELENGQLREMPPESWQNTKIAMYLLMEIAKVISFERISLKTEIITSGNRVNARIPDLVVLSPEGLSEIELYKRAVVTLDMPPPVLVVEVVSPGKANRDKDYRYKRSEYAARGIEHYWIIDPQEQKFVCLQLQDGLYESEIHDVSSKMICFDRPFKLNLDCSQIFPV